MYVGHYELELETIPVIEFRTEEPETFGEYIRKLRILKGWSQRQLAARIGASPETIARWEKDRYIPRRKTIEKLIKILDGDPWEAIEFDGVITERQNRILEHFGGKAAFTHRQCMELLGSGNIHNDLDYLMDIGVLERELEGITGYYRIRK